MQKISTLSPQEKCYPPEKQALLLRRETIAHLEYQEFPARNPRVWVQETKSSQPEIQEFPAQVSIRKAKNFHPGNQEFTPNKNKISILYDPKVSIRKPRGSIQRTKSFYPGNQELTPRKPKCPLNITQEFPPGSQEVPPRKPRVSTQKTN